MVDDAIRFIGIDPLKIYRYSHKEIHLLFEYQRNRNMITAEALRDIRADMRIVAINPMSGKPYFPKVKRSSDLYPLPSDGMRSGRSRAKEPKTGREAYEMLMALNDKLPENY